MSGALPTKGTPSTAFPRSTVGTPLTRARSPSRIANAGFHLRMRHLALLEQACERDRGAPDLDESRAGRGKDVVVEERRRRGIGQQERDVGNAEEQVVRDGHVPGLRRLPEDQDAAGVAADDVVGDDEPVRGLDDERGARPAARSPGGCARSSRSPRRSPRFRRARRGRRGSRRRSWRPDSSARRRGAPGSAPAPGVSGELGGVGQDVVRDREVVGRGHVDRGGAVVVDAVADDPQSTRPVGLRRRRAPTRIEPAGFSWSWLCSRERPWRRRRSRCRTRTARRRSAATSRGCERTIAIRAALADPMRTEGPRPPETRGRRASRRARPALSIGDAGRPDVSEVEVGADDQPVSPREREHAPSPLPTRGPPSRRRRPGWAPLRVPSRHDVVDAERTGVRPARTRSRSPGERARSAACRSFQGRASLPSPGARPRRRRRGALLGRKSSTPAA